MIHIDLQNHPFRRNDFTLLITHSVEVLSGDLLFIKTKIKYDAIISINKLHGKETYKI